MPLIAMNAAPDVVEQAHGRMMSGLGQAVGIAAMPNSDAQTIVNAFGNILQATRYVAELKGNKAYKKDLSVYQKYLKANMPLLKNMMLYFGQIYPNASISSALQQILTSQDYSGAISVASAAGLSGIMNQTFGAAWQQYQQKLMSMGPGKAYNTLAAAASAGVLVPSQVAPMACPAGTILMGATCVTLTPAKTTSTQQSTSQDVVIFPSLFGLGQVSATPTNYALMAAQAFNYILQAYQSLAASKGNAKQANYYKGYIGKNLPKLKSLLIYLGQPKQMPHASLNSILQSGLDTQTYSNVASQAAAAGLSKLMNQSFGSMLKGQQAAQAFAAAIATSLQQQQAAQREQVPVPTATLLPSQQYGASAASGSTVPANEQSLTSSISQIQIDELRATSNPGTSDGANDDSGGSLVFAGDGGDEGGGD